MKINKVILPLILILFAPSLFNFFSADDWFHLRLAQISSLSEFLNFFSFTASAQSASFYRPLSTQVFFYIFHSLFGLNAFFYYLFGLLLFALILLQLKNLVLVLFPKISPITALVVYGFSVTNFTRLYFLSAYQELFLSLFALLALNAHLRSQGKKTLLFFILALLSKETAVVIPGLILLIDLYQGKLKLSRHLPLFLFTAIYLYLRLFHFGLAEGDTYIWDFSPKMALNTLMWYTLWSFGAPELLVDYIGGGLRPIPRFYTDYPFFSYFILFFLLVLLTSFAFLIFRSLKKNLRQYLFTGLFFVVPLLPVLFLPHHKFTLELGLPLVGFSLLFALVANSAKGKWGTLLLGLFLILNLSMNYLTYTRHYSVNRSRLSHRLYDYLTTQYPQYPSDPLYFTDPDNAGRFEDYAKQLSLATSRADMFKVIYNDPNLVFYFDGINQPPEGKPVIKIKAQDFFTR